MKMYHATFSVVAKCSKTRSLGVCVSTARPAVGDRVPHIEAEVGVIATQANTNVAYGTMGLTLLRRGFAPEKALEDMLKKDPDRETRQVIIIDRNGRTAAFTGRETKAWRGHLIGDNYVVAGNMLKGGNVIKAMAKTFERSVGEALPERLIEALEAGQKAGGDRRGKVSAALLVTSEEQTAKQPFVDIRVDENTDPIRELRRIFRTYSAKIRRKERAQSFSGISKNREWNMRVPESYK